MKNKSSHRFLTTTATALFAVGLLSPAAAHARGRSTTISGARGGVYHRQITQTPGNVSAASSATLPNGKTATRTLASGKTETGHTTSARVTGFNGKTATFDSTATKTDTGYTRQASSGGPDGATATKHVNVSRENGIVARTVTTTRTAAPTP